MYDKAVRTVPEDARLAIYDRYLKRASTFFGIAKVRAGTRRAAIACPVTPCIPLLCSPWSIASRLALALHSRGMQEPHLGSTHVFALCSAACGLQVREIYEMAVEAEPPYSLSDADCKTMCLRYARVEKQARACPALPPLRSGCHACQGYERWAS